MSIVRISVTDFAQKSLRTGDIDERRELMQIDPELGIEIHQKIQSRLAHEIPKYQSEIKIDLALPNDDLVFNIIGRVDGMWQITESHEVGPIQVVIVDEIKSTWSISRLKAELENDSQHPYLMQARLYAWILSQDSERTVRPQLRLVSAIDRTEEVVAVEFDVSVFESWLQNRAKFLRDLWHESDRWDQRAKKEGKKLKFPFKLTRPGQEAMRADVEVACKSKKNLLAQAPTGIGKTAAVLFPALHNTLSRGDKLIHITPKNSQQREAESLVRKLHRRKREVKALTLTSKAKICMLETEPTCRPDLCPYAKGHYDKVNAHELLEKLKSQKIVDRNSLRELAAEFTVCPWELSRQILPWVDVIIGDYHYGLAPQGNVVDIAQRPFDPSPKPILTIDEAHNLAERSRDWYSIKLLPIPEEVIRTCRKQLRLALRDANEWLARHRPLQKQVTREFQRQDLHSILERWSKQMPHVIASLSSSLKRRTDESEKDLGHSTLLTLWFEWRYADELLTSGHNVFFAMASDLDSAALQIHCGNAGPFLAETFQKFRSVVAFSATLKPFSYHLSMWGQGLQSSKTTAAPQTWVTKEYLSPFDSRNRCIIAIPQISTKYRDRSRQIPRIAEVIDRVTAEKSGNYVVFFPSFELQGQVATFMQANGRSEIMIQPRHANPSWVKQTIRHLEENKNLLLFAVQGGVLSEGIDLPDDRLIGAIIVGPAIPTMSPEREEMRRIFADAGDDGFAMAYIHPAMAKSIQSAGRVIRTETDRGVIVLLDDRFLDPVYTASMPEDWLEGIDSARDLVPASIIGRLKEFWQQDTYGAKENGSMIHAPSSPLLLVT